MSDKPVELEIQSPLKLMWKYFVPAFIGLMVQTLYNIIDRIFIGQVIGVDGLAGLTLVMPIMMMIIAFGTLTGMGTGILVSINLGKKDGHTAEKILGTGFASQIIIAVFVSVAGFLTAEPMLKALNPNPAAYQYALNYLNIILLGVVFQTTGWGMNNVIRSQGYARIAMYSMIFSACTNIVLDAVFILILDMGVEGAATATVLSQLVLAAWVMAHITKKTAHVRLKLRHIKINLKYFREIATVGFASFAMHIAGAAVRLVQNERLLVFGDDTAVAAMGVISGSSLLIFMTLNAINMASQPIIGFNHGAKQFRRVKSTLHIALIWAVGVSTLGFVMGELIPGVLIKMFNNNSPELLELGKRAMRICFMLFPLVGFMVVASSYFQSIGLAKKAAFLSLLRQFIILIPLLIFLPKVYGLDGVWISWPLSDVLAFLVSFTLFRVEYKKLNNRIRQKNQEPEN